MADPSKIANGNVDGDFFVDTACITCGNCYDLAPSVFDRVGPYYVVVKQPETEEELSQTLDALVCCPVGSVGSRQRHNIKPVIDSFPRLMAGNVFYLGFNSPKSYGGKSYFIDDDGGNWMVDSPKFTPQLVRWIEERGGLRYIFLTHKDDVADASAYGAKFGAQRIIHEKDSQAQKDAEVILQGTEEVRFEDVLCIIPTPGHTEGHCMLLYRNEFLFTGDVLTSMRRFGDKLEVMDPAHCWWSWTEQTKSLERLLGHEFQWTLPSHGRWYHSPAADMRRALTIAIARAKAEVV